MTMPFVTIDTWTMIFQWCNLFILFLLVKKFLFKPIQKILDQRDQEIHDMYDKAKEDRKDAKLMRSEYTRRLDNAKEESETIVKNAVRKARGQSETIIKDAHERAEQIVEKAEEQIEMERREATNQVKDDISDMAVSIAEKIVERDIKKSDHERMIQDIINRMGDAS